MADPTDTVPDLRDLGVVSNGNSSDNNSECSGQAAEDGEDSTGGNSGGAWESRDPDCVEERFRVDRKKLEEMLQAAQDGKSETGEEFFQRIMQQTDTRITWPSKLKIGAKSKKDPHIKVTGRPEDIAAAKEKIMSVLDTKSNRVTLKMDVSYTEHSHVIGKGGNSIKKVMHETNCHIHFPDSNRGPQQEKSNQVSIAGLVGGAEQARAKIRELLPLVLVFELPISNNPAPDINSPTIQQIVQLYNIGVNMKQRARGYSTTVTVRGASSNADMVKNATLRLMEYLTGNIALTLQVSTQIEITPQHHQFMNGRNGLNIKHIMQTTGARIHFPDPNGNGGGNNTQRKSSVFISGTVGAVIVARDLLMGCLPLVLMFDVKDEVEIDPAWLAQLMEKLDVFINVKPKLRQPSKSVIVKSIEKNAPNMYRARQSLLGQECESCAAHCGNAKKALNGMSVLLPNYPGVINPGIVNIASVNVHNMNSLNGLSRVNALQTTQSSMGELSWPVVSQQNPRLTRSFPSNLTPVLISHQTPNPLLIPQTQLPRHPNPNSPKHSNPTLNPHPNSNPSPNITPPLNPNPNQLLSPTTTPISQPHLAKLVSAPAHLSHGYVLSSTIPPPRSSTTINTHPPTVSHTVHLQPPFQANSHPDILSTTPNNTQSNRPSYLPNQKASHFESNRLIRPNPRTMCRRDDMSNITLGVCQTRSPPPGLVRADPMELRSLELATRELIDSCRFEAQPSHIKGCLSSPTKERVMSSSTSSSTSPTHSPCNSPVDLITMPTTCPLNNNHHPKFMDLGCFHINASSSSSSGSLSDALMGSGGRGSIMLMPDGTLGLTSVGSSGLEMRRSTSDSGSDVNSSDKRAPGCERREREREHEHAREDFEIERRRSHEEKYELDRLTLQSTFTAYSRNDYDQKKLLADKAMKRKPVVSKVQKPTDMWSGLGFSKSMPESAIREQQKLNGFTLFDSEKLPTTYENSLKEDAERSTGESSWPPERSGSPEDLMPSPPSENQQANSSVAIGEYPVNRRNKVAYANLSSSNYIEGATLPRPTKGLWPSGEHHSLPATKPDLTDLLINLGLGKYLKVFQQQEIDLSTFLTLTENDLKELGITTLGARRKMLLAISDMNKNNHTAFPFNASSSTTLRHEESKGPNNGLVHSHYTPTSLW